LNDFILVVKALGMERLDQVMGTVVVDAALADLSPRVVDLSGQVLSLADRCNAIPSTQRGCWVSKFSLQQSSALQEEQGERVHSITAAARELAAKVSLEVFGPASSGMATLTAICLPYSASLDLDRALNAAPDTAHNSSEHAAIQSIIDSRSLRTMLQPIVTMPEGRVVGLEALSRGPLGSPYERADLLFGAAARNGLTEVLELACAAKAISYWKQLPESVWMSVNTSAGVMPGVLNLMSADASACARMILELTEHLPLGKVDALRPTLDAARARGTRIALDDTGCGYADLDVAGVIEADIVKLCITVIGRLEQHPQVRAAVTEAVQLAHQNGALILAEGVETEAQASILKDIGVDLAQGWLYGRPFAASDLADWQPVTAAVAAVA
jgi:EAL domain-containing protein (putative c-di-GMP-specific phosphodiesterase class I)